MSNDAYRSFGIEDFQKWLGGAVAKIEDYTQGQEQASWKNLEREVNGLHERLLDIEKEQI